LTKWAKNVFEKKFLQAHFVVGKVEGGADGFLDEKREKKKLPKNARRE